MSEDDGVLSLDALNALLAVVNAARARHHEVRPSSLDDVSVLLTEAVQLMAEGHGPGTLEYERARGLGRKALATLKDQPVGWDRPRKLS